MDSMEDFEWDESDLGLERDDERQNETSIKIMQKALNQMGGKCKEILKLFYYQEMKLDEIVETMSYENKDVAKSQKSRCLKNLRKLINEIK